MRAACALLAAAPVALAAPSCGDACGNDAECNAGSGGKCIHCLGGMCGNTCGETCAADAQCLTAGCGFCYAGVCSSTDPGNTCGSRCGNTANCAPAGAGGCSQCTPSNNATPPALTCGAGCGGKCEHDSQCTQFGCNKCSGPTDPVPGVCGKGFCRDIVDLAIYANLSTLVTAVSAGGLVDTLRGPGPFTVFAPTNAAFAALPPGTLDHLLKPENKAELDDILTYHVLAGRVLSGDLSDGMTATTVEGKNVTVHIAGGTVKINDATVVTPDVLACNGVVHVIDAVLLPPTPPAPTPPAPTPAPCKDIVALAQSVPDLSTLVTAVVAGGLVQTLQGAGPFTVFAPTNAAFAALPSGTLEKLLKPENKAALDDILTYHVLAAKVLSSDLQDGQTATTVEGKNVTVHISAGTVKINGATVVTPDVLACNGVVHVIDAVLLPPNATIA